MLEHADADPVPQVLIVDTDAERARTLAMVIARQGARGFRVETGGAAVRRIEAEDYRLIVIAGLHDGSTRAFVAWVRRNYPALRLLAIAQDGDQALELSAGGADHVAQLDFGVALIEAHVATLLEPGGRLRLAA